MDFRNSIISDIPDIINIINQAKTYFKNNNIDQWQNGYPNEEVINSDITNKESYVLLKESKVIATTVISFSGDGNYDKIYDGKWLSSRPYGVIHRIAVDNTFKGLGLSHKLIIQAENLCLKNNIKSLRADTHEQNIPMQRLLESNGFTYCGIIYVSDGGKRLAFEKLL